MGDIETDIERIKLGTMIAGKEAIDIIVDNLTTIIPKVTAVFDKGIEECNDLLKPEDVVKDIPTIRHEIILELIRRNLTVNKDQMVDNIQAMTNHYRDQKETIQAFIDKHHKE